MSESTTANTALAHHFDNMEQQREAGTLGMWIFLLTEIMFFGGAFTAYIVYRNDDRVADAFVAASNTLNVPLGLTNTAVLIISSLTMALADYYAQTGSRKLQVNYMVLTVILGTVFLVIKGFEYADKVTHRFESASQWLSADFGADPVGERMLHERDSPDRPVPSLRTGEELRAPVIWIRSILGQSPFHE